MNLLELKTILFCTFFIFIFTSYNNHANCDEMSEVKTVDYVDINKYMGIWYEIAKIPNRFQKNCAGNTIANYKLIDEVNVEVVNSCLETNGKTNKASGVAKVVNNKTNAKLKVSFFSIFGIHFFWGNYWILYLDKDYHYAVIGEPKRKYGWILSRQTKLSESELKPIYENLEQNGYDTARFEFTKQNITN